MRETIVRNGFAPMAQDGLRTDGVRLIGRDLMLERDVAALARTT